MSRREFNVLRCRECGWETPKWSTRGDRKVNGWKRLEEHLEDAHGVLANLTDQGDRDGQDAVPTIDNPPR